MTPIFDALHDARHTRDDSDAGPAASTDPLPFRLSPLPTAGSPRPARPVAPAATEISAFPVRVLDARRLPPWQAGHPG